MRLLNPVVLCLSVGVVGCRGQSAQEAPPAKESAATPSAAEPAPAPPPATAATPAPRATVPLASYPICVQELYQTGDNEYAVQVFPTGGGKLKWYTLAVTPPPDTDPDVRLSPRAGAPKGGKVPERTDDKVAVYTAVEDERLSLIVADPADDTEVIRLSQPLPTSPSVDQDGKLVARPASPEDTPCAMGVMDGQLWTPDRAFVTVTYSVSDLCDGRGEPLCTFFVFPNYKDMPVAPWGEEAR